MKYHIYILKAYFGISMFLPIESTLNYFLIRLNKNKLVDKNKNTCDRLANAL